MTKFGCPEKFVHILRLLQDNMTARILSNNSATNESFNVQTGVKQACMIAPTLFSIFVATFMHLVKNRITGRKKVVYRMDGGLFNLTCKRLKATTKTSNKSVVELQYAEDNIYCVCASSE